MSGYPRLIIGGIELPLRSLLGGLTQEYEELAGITELRMANGRMFIQRAWPETGYKLRTTLSGEGRLPAPLDHLDRGMPHEISCIEHRAITGNGIVVALPAGRRSDPGYEPRGYALVDGELVETALNIVVNDATLTNVIGAQHFQVRYWPEFKARITHRSSGTPLQALRGWTLTLDEI